MSNEDSQLLDRRKKPVFIHSELDDLPLTMEAFRVYCHLSRRAGADGRCFPSYKTIGKTCFRGSYPDSDENTWRRKAIAAMKELEAWNLVSIEKNRDGDRNFSNNYVLTEQDEWRTLDLMQNWRPESARKGSNRKHEEVVSGEHQGSAPGTLGSDGGAPKGYPKKKYPIEETNISAADADDRQQQSLTAESGASPKAQVTKSANARASLNERDSREGSEKEPCRTSLESGSQNSHTEVNSTSRQKDSALSRTKTKQTASKRGKTPEEIAEQKANREAKAAEDKAKKEAERDRKNARYYEFFGSKERYNQFLKYYQAVLHAKETEPTSYGKEINTMLNSLLLGYEFASNELVGFEAWELKQLKRTEAEQKNALAAQAANSQPTQQTTPGNRPQLPNPEDYLSPANLAAFNKANFDEDLRAKCIAMTYGKAEYSQANTIRAITVDQSNRNKSKA